MNYLNLTVQITTNPPKNVIAVLLKVLLPVQLLMQSYVKYMNCDGKKFLVAVNMPVECQSYCHDITEI